MEQKVAEAARAMVRGSTDSATRTAASQFLEQWTLSPEAWEIYVKWLHSFQSTSNATDNEEVGMQHLCLTLLHAKIRREVPRGTPMKDSLSSISNECGLLIQRESASCGGGATTTTTPRASFAPLCKCVASLAVRCGTLSEIIAMCRPAGSTIALPNALRILAYIPHEVEACADLTSSQVTSELWPYLERVLDTIRIALLGSEDSIIPALEALKNWAAVCQISLSHLNTPTCGGSESLLLPLIHLLSQPQPPRADVLIFASQALTEAVQVSSDIRDPAGEAAVSLLFSSIASHGFVAAPLAHTTQQEWEDASHALASMLCTLVAEETNYICPKPAEACLSLLLQIQAHPHTSVTLTALECWLTVQEVPTASRHNNWKAPLFTKVIEGLISRVALPMEFTNWQNEINVDQSEFEELRRMSEDVLTSAYFLLRGEFVKMMTSSITSSSNPWQIVEASLFCLCKVAREVSARIKARGGGTSVSSDRDATAQQLLQLVEEVCGSNVISAAEVAARKHPLILSGVCNFIGSYAPSWNVKCSPEGLLQLLAYLRAAMLTLPQTAMVDASKATRSILISCASRLLSCKQNHLYTTLRDTLDSGLASENEEAMAAVAEGFTRLLVQIKDERIVSESLANLVGPLRQRAEAALAVIPVESAPMTAEVNIAVESLARYLHILQVILQFCDTGTAPISEVVASVWPILEQTSQRVTQYEILLDRLIAIHQQLLRNASEVVGPYFQQAIKFVVQVFEAYRHPSSLEYIATAVESFGESNVESFKELLGHVSVVLFAFITKEKRPDECPDLIRAYFEMTKRYVLYCPAALTGCEHFRSIVSMAVDCLTSCRGERESTRATLIFLTQLFGWRLLRLNKSASAALESSSGIIDEQLGLCGRTVTHGCVAGLMGGPTMLWPAYSDCLFAIINVAVARQTVESPTSVDNNNATIAHQWMYEAHQEGYPSPETYHQVVGILVSLARNGTKAKPKAKMLLTDFAKIAKGEMTPDILLSYSLGGQ